MGQKYVIDGAQLRERQVAHAGTGVDQDILITSRDVVRTGAPIPPLAPNIRIFIYGISADKRYSFTQRLTLQRQDNLCHHAPTL